MPSRYAIQFSKGTFFLICGAFGLLLSSNALLMISLALLGLILFERQLGIKIPSGIAMTFVGFIVASLVLGSYFDFYERFLWWDDLLHAFYGGAFALLGFFVIQYISVKRGITNDAFVICLFSLCFSIAFGALWEVYEFAYDEITGGNMQRTDQGRGVDDTMHDVILETTAALVTNIFIYLYLAVGTRNFVGRLWEEFLSANK